MGRMCYLYMCEGAGCGAQELPVHVRRCWVWGARVTCTREKVLGVGCMCYLYTCEGAGCGAQELPVHVRRCEGAGCGAQELPVHV